MEQIVNHRGAALTRDMYYQLIHELWRSFPPPVSDDPDEVTCRDNAAIARIASMLPADPDEAALACHVVAASAHGMDCLRLAKKNAADLRLAIKCRAQALSMLGQACRARSLLMRLQTARRKCAALGIVSDEPVWSDHGILDRMSTALKRTEAFTRKVSPAAAAVAAAPEPAVSAMVDVTPAAVVSSIETISDIRSVETVARPASPAPAALAETDFPPAGDVSNVEIISDIRSRETAARPASTAPHGDPPDGPARPDAASLPPNHPEQRPVDWSEAPHGRPPGGLAPSGHTMPAAHVVAAALNRTPHPAEPVPRAA